MNNEKYTELDFDQYQQLYEQIGSKNLSLQSDIAKEVTTNQLDLYMKTVDFIYRIISVLGIFAGFGFTAMSYVNNFNMFIMGEIILLALILIGLFFIPKVYITEYNALEDTLRKNQREVFSPRNQVLGRIVDTYIKKGHIKHSDMEEIQKYDNKLLEIMEVSDEKKNNPFEKPINIGLVTSSIGLILIILSFLSFFNNPKYRLVNPYSCPYPIHEYRR